MEEKRKVIRRGWESGGKIGVGEGNEEGTKNKIRRQEGRQKKGRKSGEKRGEMMWIGNSSAHVLFITGYYNGERK